jgi:hypothetical protein
MKRAVIGLLIAAVLACGGITLLFAAGVVRRVAIYEIPDGYRGRLAVVYAQAGKPTISHSLFTETVRFDMAGFVTTQSRLAEGWGIDEFYYVDSSGRRLRSIPTHEVGFRFVRTGPFQGKTATVFSFSLGVPADGEKWPPFEAWLSQHEKKG